MTDRHILDNQARTVASYLRQVLGGADDFRAISNRGSQREKGSTSINCPACNGGAPAVFSYLL